MRHGREEGHIGAGLLRQPEGGVVDHLNAPRVHHNQARAVLLDGRLHLQTDDGVRLGGI